MEGNNKDYNEVIYVPVSELNDVAGNVEVEYDMVTPQQILQIPTSRAQTENGSCYPISLISVGKKNKLKNKLTLSEGEEIEIKKLKNTESEHAILPTMNEGQQFFVIDSQQNEHSFESITDDSHLLDNTTSTIILQIQDDSMDQETQHYQEYAEEVLVMDDSDAERTESLKENDDDEEYNERYDTTVGNFDTGEDNFHERNESDLVPSAEHAHVISSDINTELCMVESQSASNNAENVKDLPDVSLSQDNFLEYIAQDGQLYQKVTTKVKNFKCPMCEEVFPHKRLLFQHLQLHFKSKNFECEECGDRFYQQHCLKLHQVTHVEMPKERRNGSVQDSLWCNICCIPFNKEFAFKQHVLKTHSHLDVSLNTNFQEFLPKHCLSSSKMTQYVCFHCKETFTDQEEFTMHIQLHSENYECVGCDRRFPNKRQLDLHSWTHLSKFVCSHCKLSFNSRSKLETHTCTTKHVRRKLPMPMQVTDQYSTSLFLCEKCNQTFKSEPDLQQHVLSHLYMFTCQVCQEKFPNATKLTEHIKETSHKHLFKCVVCTETFPTTVLARDHEERAHNMTTCPICKELLTKEERKTHSHVFHPTIKCDLCPLMFSTDTGLKIHKQKAHSSKFTHIYFHKVIKTL
ncbi:unnamed protein product [Timema podura]|uniref:C2H2-type domain-containing protein n=1 Tax=Timema podura TaxID=61482 RepID=A0ABN7NSG5_TIMPD|nr:unnamed protein product [Timema podura]